MAIKCIHTDAHVTGKQARRLFQQVRLMSSAGLLPDGMTVADADAWLQYELKSKRLDRGKASKLIDANNRKLEASKPKPSAKRNPNKNPFRG